MYTILAKQAGTGRTITIKTVDGALISGLVTEAVNDVAGYGDEAVKIGDHWVAVRHVTVVYL